MGYRNKKAIILLIMIISTMVFAGCSKDESASEKKPNVIHNHFLMFTEESVDEEGRSIGNLYIQSVGKEKEKIASDVVDGSFMFINHQNKVLFKNDENELYKFVIGKESEKVKLAEEVSSFQGDYTNDIVTFLKEDGDFYIVQGENEDEKIASNVRQYDVIGECAYYIDDDGDFTMYQLKDRQETEIASDVVYFTALNDKDEVAYLDEDQSLYYRKASDDQSIKITNDEVSSASIKKVGKQIVYYNIEDEDSVDLYQSTIEEGSKSKKIASDIKDYRYSNGYFYYTNSDDNLYRKKDTEDNSKKLASDVADFTIKKDTIVYMDTEDKLFSLKGEEKPKKIASSVKEYDVAPDGEVIYLTEDKDLYVDGKKISSDVQQYKHYYGNVSFSTEDEKLYLIEKMGEKKVIEEDLNQFSSASYQNRKIYLNYLTFEDVSGVWMTDEGEGNYYIGIDKDGNYTYYLSGESEKLELDYAGYRYLSASSKYSDLRFELGEDNTLLINMDGTRYTFSKSSKADAEEYAKKLMLEMDKQDISYLMDRYLSNFDNAVNYGNPNYITQYIYSGSNLYQEQIKFVNNTYENNIREYLQDYDIENIENTGEGVYAVTVMESFKIYDDSSYEGVTKNYKNTYTVKKINDQFYIIDLKVAQTDASAL